MRLCRIDIDRLESHARLADLASAGQLDLLQLDYAPGGSQSHSANFLEHFRRLHKHLYLEPDLRIITNAGGSGVVLCVEALGGYLREHADERLLISAIRGDNLLPRLEELTANGFKLLDEITRKPLADLKQPLLAAQVQLGAGPLATAWEEGARIVVAGCYDIAAPYIGALVAERGLTWTDYNALASVAIAAGVGDSELIAETYERGELTLEPAHIKSMDTERLLERLASANGLIRHADVDCNIRRLEFRPTQFGKLSIEGVTGHTPPDSWRVQLTYAAGNVIDSLPQMRLSRIPRDAVRVSVDTRPASEWY